jgi:ribosomal protein S1
VFSVTHLFLRCILFLQQLDETSIGDEVEVALDLIEDGLGATLLSRDKAKKHQAWGDLEKAYVILISISVVKKIAVYHHTTTKSIT